MVDQAMVEKLKHWIRTRETIRIGKESGVPGPWSDDPILNNNHFCNVRREDDRGTKELRAVVREAELGLDELPYAYTLARLFNHAPSLDCMLRYGPGGVDMLERRMRAGQRVFNTAYLVSTCGASVSKVEYCYSVAVHVANTHIPATTLAAAYGALRTVHGLGSFMAGQVVADLKNDRYLKHAADWASWAVIGPGSKKGMDYLHGGGTTEKNFWVRLMNLYDELGPEFMGIHAQDLQNCLCEFQKFIAIEQGTRKRSRPYHAIK